MTATETSTARTVAEPPPSTGSGQRAPDGHAVQRLPRSAAAPQLARRRVRRVCLAAGVPAAVIENTALVAGELVGLALRQSRAPLGFEVWLHEHGVEVRVHDTASIEASLFEPPGIGTHRSTELVRRLCRTWGMHVTESERLLWAIVAVPRHGAVTGTSFADGDHRQT